MTPAEIRTLAREFLADRSFRLELVEALAVEAGRQAFSIDEAAARVGCGRDLIYSEINAGRLATWTVGTRRFIRRGELERWASEREREAVAS